MKTQRRKRPRAPEIAVSLGAPAIFSSDLLTPEEERELLTAFWECKVELVKVLIRHFPRLRSHRPRQRCDSGSRSGGLSRHAHAGKSARKRHRAGRHHAHDRAVGSERRAAH